MPEDQNGKNPVAGHRPGDDDLSVKTTGLLNVAVPPIGDRNPHERAAFEQSNTTVDERKRGMLVLFAALMVVGMGQSMVFTILPPQAPYVLCGLLMTMLLAALYIHPAFKVIREREPAE
jgi:hypothetical protein